MAWEKTQVLKETSLRNVDSEVFRLLKKQIEFERSTLKMIASENYASDAVLEATGSIFTNKYAEGYPGARYYEGNKIVDEVESLAAKRLCDLFGAEHANVQPLSGSPANAAAYRATIGYGDKVMGMPVSEGGHLTHGWKVNFSGMDYVSVPYGMDPATGRVDYDEVRKIAKRDRPKLIWVGGTAYPRAWDYEAMASVASEVDAYLVADIAHINGLIVAGAHPNPTPHVDIVTSTTHKTIRGPRGGFILSRIEDRYQELYHADSKFNLAKRIDRAIFPTLQGGPHIHAVAALAVTLKEAASQEFKTYGHQIVANSRTLAEQLMARGYTLVSGGTDTHLLLLDLRDREYSGKDAAKALAAAGIITNFNMVPGDPRKPFVTSGIRLGTAALTTMGMREPEMKRVADFFDRVLSNIDRPDTFSAVRKEVRELALQFPPPGYTDPE